MDHAEGERLMPGPTTTVAGIGALIVAAGLAGMDLVAQGAETPTTIVGAFILICVSVVTLVGWLVKHLLTNTIPAQQQQFATALTGITSTCTGMVDRLGGDSQRRHEELKGELEKQIDCLRAWQRTDLENQQLLRQLIQAVQLRTRMADVVISADDAIWTKTLTGVILAWNPAAERILGWKGSEVIGQSVHKIIPGDRHNEEDELLARIRNGEQAETGAIWRIHRDGRLVKLWATTSPIKDAATGQIIGASTIAREG
jgi:PAS domain S-box-containing protein